MKVEIRKTLTGTEYWDTEAKRTLFVPTGEKPKFEVTENPKSMLNESISEINQVAKEVGEALADSLKEIKKMTVAELKDYAVANDIEIPADITKKDDIIQFLTADGK